MSPATGAPHVQTHRSFATDAAWMLLLTLLSVTLLSLIFPPRNLWPLALVGLAPWTVGVCRVERQWVIYWLSILGGWSFFLVNLYWLMPVTGLGYVALALYLSLYWAMAAWALRIGLRAGIGPTWTLPCAWVACEFLRGWAMTGFPWLFLAHAFHEQVAFIQIADFGGAYAVTFIAAMINGVLAEWLLALLSRREPRRAGVPWLNSALTAAAVVGTIYYGNLRLQDARFVDGPRVAVIQEDFPQFSVPPYTRTHLYEVLGRHFALAADAMRESPDLVVFPETAWSSTQNVGFLAEELRAVDDQSAVTWQWGKLCHEVTSAFARGDYAAVNRQFENLDRNAQRRGLNLRIPRLPPEGGPPVTVIVGSVALDVFPEQAYPRQKRFNSALIYDPDGQQRAQRYDKTHLVPFGEIVPFRNATFVGIDLHWLYRALNRLSPFSDAGRVEYSLWPGAQHTIFPFSTARGQWRFGVPICYEDVVPYVMRSFVWDGSQRRADFLVNISNDGWFLHSSELPQHFAICVFRAVENRVGIARAVNTGISGFIDPSGRAYGKVARNGVVHGRGVIGYSVQPMKLDQRASAYGRVGDLFAISCLVLTSALWVGGIVTRWVLGAAQHIRAWMRPRSAADAPPVDHAAP